VQSGIIAQVKSTLPGVAAVTNPVAADGGANEETVAMVEERGPQTLRHRNHAVASSDIEWLVRQGAGMAVARTKCLPNVNRDLRFEPGWVTVIVVPQGSRGKLLPSSELLSALESYIQSYAFLGLTQQGDQRINLVGPGYIGISIKVELVPSDLSKAAAVKAEALAALTAFFHPLTGGANGTGWDFGRNVYASEVFKVMQDLPGIDHVESLALIPNAAQYSLGLRSGQPVGTSLPAASAVMTPDRGKMMLLAEPVQVLASSEQIGVRGFKEGDRVTIAKDLSSPKATGKTVSVDSFTADVPFPKGSMVMSLSGGVFSRLAVGVPAGPLQTQLVLEDASLGEVVSLDGLTVLYPFPMTVISVTMNKIRLTVLSVSGTVITVSPFQSGDVVPPPGTPVVLSGEPDVRSTLKVAIPRNLAQTQIQVSDAKFAQTLQRGDVLVIDSPIQTLGLEPCETRVDIPVGSTMTTLDNRGRAPLLTEVAAGQEFTSIDVEGFMHGDQVVIARRDGIGKVSGLTVAEAVATDDIVYVDDNFLVYSGNHEVSVIGESERPNF